MDRSGPRPEWLEGAIFVLHLTHSHGVGKPVTLNTLNKMNTSRTIVYQVFFFFFPFDLDFIYCNFRETSLDFIGQRPSSLLFGTCMCASFSK